MPLLIPQLLSCSSVPWAEDEDVFRCLTSSAAAAERGRHRGDSGLVEKSVRAIYSHSQLDSQRALSLPELFIQPQNVCPWGGLDQIVIGRAFC